MMLSLVACGGIKDESSSVSDELSSESSEPISLESDEIFIGNTEVGPYALDINVQYIRTNGFAESVEFPSTVVIKTGKQLNEYYEEFKDDFYLERVDKVYSDTTIGFLDACDKYTDEFFNENYLVFVRLREGNGSIRHTVTRLTYGGYRPTEVEYQNDYSDINLDIRVARHSPEEQTDDMAEWHIILEISNEYMVKSEDKVNVNVYTSSPEDILNAQMNFAAELFKESVKQSENENVLVSPLSVQLALAMTANGANGKTLSEMQTLLSGDALLTDLNGYFEEYLLNLSSEEEKLKIANSIWVRDVESLILKDSFVKINEDKYNAQIFRKAFDQATVDEINGWVDKNTDGLINQIIDRIDSNAVMYLINALCFEDEWKHVYSKYDISNGEFLNAAGEKRAVEMMRSEEGKYIETETAKGFVKDYKGSRYSFVAVLPNEDVNINDYIASLDAENLKELITGVKRAYGIAKMPKFKSEYFASLNGTLKNLGIPTAFEAADADFSNMAESADGNIYIGNVLHKTFVQVDELGTKAGAVTSVEMDTEAEPMYEWELTLDKPFVYMIIDNETNLPIFIGVLNDITE